MDTNAVNKSHLAGNFEFEYNRKSGRFDCDTCGKMFKKPCLLFRHRVVHSASKPFECSQCHKRFTQSSSLKRHYAEQHNSKSRRYQCAKCPLNFSQKSNLSLHDKKVHPPEVVRKTKGFAYACEKCSAFFINKQKFSRHLKTVHSDNGLDLTSLDDDLTLTQNVLEQLKSFQTEMQALEAPTIEENAENTTTIHLKADKALQKHVDKPVSIDVQLMDHLDEQGTEFNLSLQRTANTSRCYKYVCEFCLKQFRKSYDITRHRRVHTGEKPYKCSFCQGAFSTKTKLREHGRIHSLDEHEGIFKKHYACAVCGQPFNSLRILDEHLNTHADTFIVKYKCKTCEATFSSSTRLWSHVHARVDEDLQYVQQLLPPPIKVFANVVKLKLKRNSLKYKCFTCNRLFSNSYVLCNHRRVHHGVYSRACRFKCAYCAQIFKIQSHCKSHMLTHLRRLLNTGTTNHMEEEQTTFIPRSVNALVMVVDAATKATIKFVPFHGISPKNKCERRVASKLHPSANKYKCHICLSQFKKSCDLKRHLVTHTGERLHKCTTCAKCFGLRGTLKQHELTHTAERRKNVCIVCGKSYTTKKSLNVHLRLHTGVQPFDCGHCELKFRTSGQRIAHMKVSHGMQKYTCIE